MKCNKAKKTLKQLLGFKHSGFEKNIENQLLLLAKAQSRANSQLSQIAELSDVEFSVFSQWGEDGVIDWLINQLPDLPRSFVEFGVENYTEANTRMLLQLRNWEGLIIDGSAYHIQEITEQEIFWKHDLVAKHAFVDVENINELIKKSGFSGNIGLLSIDIDGNDYWVWDAIDIISPAIVVVEYNAVLGDLHQLTVPYNANFQRTKAHYSNLYFGASLPALIDLGEKKGFTFLGTTSSGVNAFFVRNELFKTIESKIESFASYPSKHRESRNSMGFLDFIGGGSRAEVIKDLPLVDLQREKTTTLHALTQIYSCEWGRHFTRSKPIQ